MSTSDVSADVIANSLTGFDRLAIAKQFGQTIIELQSDPLAFLTALVFIDQKRRDQKDSEAYKYAMSLPMSEMKDYFAEPEPEFDADDPVTDEGKGEGLS